MSDASDPGRAALEQRLAGIERALEAKPGGAERALDRAARYLPLLALSNLFVSAPAFLISIGVAYFTFVQAEATEKMQVASVWPRVTYTTSNQTEDGTPRITLSLENKGVGPAMIRGLEVRMDDRPYVGFRDILGACCTDRPEDVPLGIGTVNGEVLRPGEEMHFAILPFDQGFAGEWQRFNEARLNLRVRACYCSVFEDCWIDTWERADPQPVDQCPTDWVQYTGFPQAGGKMP